MSDRLLTLAEAADELRCSVTTIKRRIRAGALPTVVDGRLVRVREVDLRRYLLERIRTVPRLAPEAALGRTVDQGGRLWD